MLLETIHHVRENHGDDRTLWGRLFGQEKNLTPGDRPYEPLPSRSG